LDIAQFPNTLTTSRVSGMSFGVFCPKWRLAAFFSGPLCHIGRQRGLS
jgi:hypothetical protein